MSRHFSTHGSRSPPGVDGQYNSWSGSNNSPTGGNYNNSKGELKFIPIHSKRHSGLTYGLVLIDPGGYQSIPGRSWPISELTLITSTSDRL